MQKVAKFEKVSYDQFKEAMRKLISVDPWDEDKIIRNKYDAIKLPSRATTGSAGYDFKSPIDFDLTPGSTIKIPTGIRVQIQDGWWLACLPRSSYGFKYRAQLDNTIGVIDSDYYHANNEGHIFIKLTNDSRNGDTLHVKVGDNFVQGVFIPYGITYDDNTEADRTGGIGSTGA